MKRALELHCHEVMVRFLEKAIIPPYEGSMIRRAFGRAFKDSCCPFPHNGAGCPLGDKCPYGYVFETSPAEGACEFGKNQEVPRPYVFEPPEETKMEYAPGERMRFGFTVMGRAAEYMPYFIYAFSKMGDVGVGRLRARYELERVIAKNPLLGTELEIFDSEVVKNRRLPTVWEDAESAAHTLDGGRFRLPFLTPPFVKFKGQVSSEAPTFAALVKALLIRIPMLSAVHCGALWQEDFKGLVKRAEEVETVSDETTWISFRRYSSFKKKSEALEGVVGGAEWQEVLPRPLATPLHGSTDPCGQTCRLWAGTLPSRRGLKPTDDLAMPEDTDGLMGQVPIWVNPFTATVGNRLADSGLRCG